MSNKYSELYTPTFSKNIKKYSSVKKPAEKKISRIISNPYHNTEPLKDKSNQKGGMNLLGFRSYRIDRNFRIVFVICEEWVKMQLEGKKVAHCPMCEELFNDNPKSIIFLTVGPHDIASEW